MAAFQSETDSEDELPPQWEERTSQDGRVYFVDHGTRATHWHHPRTGRAKRVPHDLPFGWERHVGADGVVVFVNHETRQTSYTDPRLALAVEDIEPDSEFRQRYDAMTPARQIVHSLDLSEKIVLITGANSGIGFETARTVALRGATVILACRRRAAAEVAIRDIRRERPAAICHAAQVDLQSFRSVQACAIQIEHQFPRLDVLILNAGVFTRTFHLTAEDQLEHMFQVNYLAQVYLAHRLKGLLGKCVQPRMVWITSESHRFSPLTEDTLTPATVAGTSKTAFIPIDAYNNSKLLMIAFSIEVNQRWSVWGIRSFPVHPGNMISSNLMRSSYVGRLVCLLARPFTKSLSQAASPGIFAGFAPEMAYSGGTYINNCFPCDPSPLASSSRARGQVWALTQDILKDKLAEIDPEFPEHF